MTLLNIKAIEAIKQAESKNEFSCLEVNSSKEELYTMLKKELREAGLLVFRENDYILHTTIDEAKLKFTYLPNHFIGPALRSFNIKGLILMEYKDKRHYVVYDSKQEGWFFATFRKDGQKISYNNVDKKSFIVQCGSFKQLFSNKLIELLG